MSSSSDAAKSTVWINLAGLTRHSTKEDVRYVLPNVSVRAAVPYVDQRYRPIGAWAVQVEEDAVNGIAEAQKEAVGKLKAVKTRVIHHSIQRERLATSFGITPTTVLLAQVPEDVTHDHIRFLFQEHRIKSIRPVGPVRSSVGRPRGREGQAYWVEFGDEQQAAIAAQEKHGTVLNKNRLQVLHYDFVAPDPPIEYEEQKDEQDDSSSSSSDSESDSDSDSDSNGEDPSGEDDEAEEKKST
jgi:hypothetical protein